VTMSEDCQNTHVINELEIPLVVLGMKDVIIAASPDGILVSDKIDSATLKKYVDSIHQRPMYEEKRWGEYKIMNFINDHDKNFTLTKIMTIRQDNIFSYQSHQYRDEVWTIIEGTAILIVDDVMIEVGRGDTVSIKRGQKHAVKALTDLKFIEVQLGSEISDSDSQKFDLTW